MAWRCIFFSVDDSLICPVLPKKRQLPVVLSFKVCIGASPFACHTKIIASPALPEYEIYENSSVVIVTVLLILYWRFTALHIPAI